jgi:hypothetical protein
MAISQNLGDLSVSITNYAELQAAVADWLARPGDTTIAAIVSDLIRLAEARINFGSGETGAPFYSPALRVRQMETRATASVDAEYVALPSDFAELRQIKINAAPERRLSFVTPQHFAELAVSTHMGIPAVYTIVGNEFRFGPAPSAPLIAEIAYYAKVPPLSDAAPTNWLLAMAPNVYLYATLLEAATYLSDDAQLPKWLAQYAAATAAFQAQDRRARHGAAPLIVRPVAATP